MKITLSAEKLAAAINEYFIPCLQANAEKLRETSKKQDIEINEKQDTTERKL